MTTQIIAVRRTGIPLAGDQFVGCLAAPGQTPPTDVPDTPRLVARGITKSFGHVRALGGADLQIASGEVIGLVGDNGAGKSTLVKALTGALRPDNGTVDIDGRPAHLMSPTVARTHGIEVVHQDLALAPDLDPVANLFLGRERFAPGRRLLGTLDQRGMRQAATEVFDRADLRLLSLDVAVRNLSGGQRQLISVVRALAFSRSIIFMDEPTAALGVRQTEQVAKLVKQAAASGVAVVLISHNIPELLEVVDRIVVMRLGSSVASIPIGEATMERLVGAMTGLG
ncbi:MULTISPECIES: ATP-binding cassette domain-containing protein [unclassified Frankia]